MTIRKLFGLLVAFAVLFAPSAVAAKHLASVPGHAMPMMEIGHCDGPSTGDHDKAPVKNCCMAMCTAVAVPPQSPSARLTAEPVPSYFSVAQSSRGFLGEIATPPPRSA